mmetsp:Transcript_27683/g.51607  ORF Transcript_27683/g.51607 Transcript_27683/m.51607 type:complete len:84 (+) Transcript_27683:340-591(+)
MIIIIIIIIFIVTLCYLNLLIIATRTRSTAHVRRFSCVVKNNEKCLFNTIPANHPRSLDQSGPSCIYVRAPPHTHVIRIRKQS